VASSTGSISRAFTKSKRPRYATRAVTTGSCSGNKPRPQDCISKPLSLSDKTVTHALLWFPAGLTNKDSADQPFEGRFLNIKNPWRDERLRRWKGYTETQYFNPENQLVSAGDPIGPDTRAVTMIPLALYGLDFEKIPALLIDFRDLTRCFSTRF